MAVSFALTEHGMPPTSLTTDATLSMEGFAITGIHLSISGIVPGISAETFYAFVKVAEKDCLISKALSIRITSEAHLAFIEN
jgi:osmotically inducible protein OsmC